MLLVQWPQPIIIFFASFFFILTDRNFHVDSFSVSVGNTCPIERKRPIPITECGMVNNQTPTLSRELEVYNDADKELNSINSLNEFNVNYFSSDDDIDEALKNKRKRIECSAAILLPFSADIAFNAFSDLRRQPSWCRYLHSVEYIGLVDVDDKSSQVPLRSSKWTVGVKGLRFSWTANDTKIKSPSVIEWESTSGLKNVGSVVFTPSPSSDSTHMKLSFTFVLPRVVSSLYRRLNIRQYTDGMLEDMLKCFRDVVVQEDL